MRKLVWICWKDIRHPQAGGAELVGHEISKRLVGDGWQVVQLVPGFRDCAPEEMIDGVKVVRVGQTILAFYRLPFHFWRHYRQTTTFLVDAFISVGSFAALMMGRRKAALIIFHIESVKWFRQTSFYGVPRWIMPFLNVTGYFIEKAQLLLLALLFRGRVMTISQSTAGELRRHGFGRDRIKVITMGVTCRRLGALSESLPKESAFTVLMIGPRKSKRPCHTSAAFAQFQKHHPEAQLWVMGWGDADHEVRDFVRRHAIPNVTFWGRVAGGERDALLQRAHVLCTSPIREGWGLVVTEANAMGTPVIGYDVPGLRDSLAFQNGYLCAPNPRAMARKLEELYVLRANDPASYEALRQRCVESSKGLTLEKTYRDFRDTIDPVLAGQT